MTLNFTPFDGDPATSADKAALRKALEFAVNTRNTMGGEMYWNALNEDACVLGSRLVALGEDRDEIHKVIGEGNAR